MNRFVNHVKIIGWENFPGKLAPKRRIVHQIWESSAKRAPEDLVIEIRPKGDNDENRCTQKDIDEDQLKISLLLEQGLYLAAN